MSFSDEDLPADIEESASEAILGLVPQKSRVQYTLVFERYEKWCHEKKIKDITGEKVLLAYFNELSKDRKPTSLWSYYSMLKTELSIRKNVDIKKCANLFAMLKRKSEGYKPKKSKILTKKHITTFLQTADNEIYLDLKVIFFNILFTFSTKYLFFKVLLIFGVAGACRRAELTNLLKEDVINEESCFKVLVRDTKTKIDREFFITPGDIEGVDMMDTVKKYAEMRPPNCTHNRFFVTYRNKKCVNIPIGINTIGAVPFKIANFLKLSNPRQYTGHCFRRSSTSILANAGADLLTVKRHGGWKSNATAEGYIETSEENKKKTAIKILGESTSSASQNKLDVCTTVNTKATSSQSGVNLKNCQNCVINIYNK